MVNEAATKRIVWSLFAGLCVELVEIKIYFEEPFSIFNSLEINGIIEHRSTFLFYLPKQASQKVHIFAAVKSYLCNFDSKN